jgi:hypothetical protein
MGNYNMKQNSETEPNIKMQKTGAEGHSYAVATPLF